MDEPLSQLTHGKSTVFYGSRNVIIFYDDREGYDPIGHAQDRNWRACFMLSRGPPVGPSVSNFLANSPVRAVSIRQRVNREPTARARARGKSFVVRSAICYHHAAKGGANIDEMFPSWQIRIFSTRMPAQLAAATLAGFANWLAAKLFH